MFKKLKVMAKLDPYSLNFEIGHNRRHKNGLEENVLKAT